MHGFKGSRNTPTRHRRASATASRPGRLEGSGGKSAIKAVEGMGAARRTHNGIVGAAVLASKGSGVYERAINHRYNGMLIEHTKDAWLEGIRQVIRSRSLQRRLSKNALDWVFKHRDIRKKVWLWEQAYNDILAL